MRAWVITRDYYQPARLVTLNTAAQPRPVRASNSRNAKPTKRGMLVAARTFKTLYDGEEITITAGRDRVLRGHAIAEAHPDYFRAA